MSECDAGYELGAADYLLKPLDPEILRAKVKVFVDLAELRREAESISHRVLHDQLTGLPNRALFIDRLEPALARLARKPGWVGVLFLDLDGFKSINDRIGHDAGDQLLIDVADRLKRKSAPATRPHASPATSSSSFWRAWRTSRRSNISPSGSPVHSKRQPASEATKQ